MSDLPQIIERLRLFVPRSLSVVGFDGIALGGYVTPALTTVSQPMLEIGGYAMQMLLDLLKATGNSIPQVVWRGIVAPSLGALDIDFFKPHTRDF